MCAAWQVLALGPKDHNRKGSCTCQPSGSDPQCTVPFHTGEVTRVLFSDDGAQVMISGSLDTSSLARNRDGEVLGRGETVRVWDVASGKHVRQLAGQEFAIVEGPFDEHKEGRVLTARGNTLLVYEGAGAQQRAESVAVPVAIFVAPQRITSVRCHGATICVGGEHGAVCILTAPFLAA